MGLLIPTTMEDIMAMVWAMDVDTMAAMDSMDTMARGLLMPSPRLLLIPTMATTAMATVWDTDMVDTMAAMDSMDTTARGPLMPSLRLLPIPTSMEDTMDMVLDMDMVMDTAMAMASTDKSSLPCSTPTRKPGHTSNSFSESPAAMTATNGLFHYEFRPPPVLPVSVPPA